MDELTDLRNALSRLNAEYEKQARPIVNRIIEIESDHRRTNLMSTDTDKRAPMAGEATDDDNA